MFKVITDVEVLAQPSTPLEFLTEQGPDGTEGNEIIEKLRAVMNEHAEILTLAAPQIGIAKRIFGIRFDNDIKFFIDPIIIKKANYKIAPETCASMPGKEILISRPEEITVVYYTMEYKYEENKLLGIAARLFDQQCQLLDGILPSELGLVSDVAEDGSLADLEEAEIDELIEFYKNYVKVKLDSMKAQIETNEEAAKKYKELMFTEKVIDGTIKVISDDVAKPGKKAAVNKVVTLSMKNTADFEKANRRAELKRFLNKKGK
jgi:peptide deformylase